MMCMFILHRMNIEIFGCLLKNAVVRKNCFYIVDLLKTAEKLNLALDDRAVKLLDKFKRETMEAMAKHVSFQRLFADYNYDVCESAHVKLLTGSGFESTRCLWRQEF